MRTLAVPSVYLFGWRAGGEFFLRDGHSVLKQAVFALFLPLPSSPPPFLPSPPIPSPPLFTLFPFSSPFLHCLLVKHVQFAIYRYTVPVGVSSVLKKLWQRLQEAGFGGKPSLVLYFMISAGEGRVL